MGRLRFRVCKKVSVSMHTQSLFVFKDPLPATNWDKVLDGTQSRPACIQVVPSFLNEFEESEDCLYINIFTPFEVSVNAQGVGLRV